MSVAGAIQVVAIFFLVFYSALQLIMVGLAVGSAVFLRRERIVGRFGRVQDLLESDLAPPVSVVISAYNEAAGIVDATRSLASIVYPRFEIVIANDGSSDETLQLLIDEFHLEWVPYPLRQNVKTAPVRGIYKARISDHVELTVVDKENGGRADGLNAAVNAAQYPYVMATDADVIVDPFALAHTMQLIAEDRDRVVAVGGNVRPLNGGVIEDRHVVKPGIPSGIISRYQILEYARSFVATKPAWASINALPNVSGAFGVFRRDIIADLGGYTSRHFGEDLDLAMRIHLYCHDNGIPYRMRFAPAAVVWTEVPATTAILRRQRVRWHRGLMTAVHDFRGSFLNPKHGTVGMLMWPFTVIFEYIAPVVEFSGYVFVPFALLFGFVSIQAVVGLYLIAVLLGVFTSLLALVLDERYGYFNSPRETRMLLTVVLLENLGLRQMTVWWRVRAIMGGESTRVWGDMERRGVSQLAS